VANPVQVAPANANIQTYQAQQRAVAPRDQGTPVDRYQGTAQDPQILDPRQAQQVRQQNYLDQQRGQMQQALSDVNGLVQQTMMRGDFQTAQQLQYIQAEVAQQAERARALGFEVDEHALCAEALQKAAREGRVPAGFGEAASRYLTARRNAHQQLGYDDSPFLKQGESKKRMENEQYRNFVLGHNRETHPRRQGDPPALEQARPQVDAARREMGDAQAQVQNAFRQLVQQAQMSGDRRALDAVLAAQQRAQGRVEAAKAGGYSADPDAVFADELTRLQGQIPEIFVQQANRYLGARSQMFQAVGESDALWIRQDELGQRLQENRALQYALIGRELPR
jgi:hypothetical protein